MPSSTALAPFEPPNHVFSAFSFIAFVMCAVPAYWHLEAWNTGTLLYMFWTGVPVLNMFINSIVWDGNALNSAPVWCDISSRIIIGSNVGIVLSSLCINRRLYKIASSKSVVNTAEDKRRAIIIDLAIGLGIPLIQQVMYVIVEGHRFNIVEDVGCWPATYVTPVAIALIFTWPVVIGMISITYSAKTVLLLYRHRRNFKSLIQASHNLNSSRYIRLMCLGGIEILTLPFAAWALAVNIQDGVFPWISWADTHSDFSRVVLIPAVLWRSDSLSVMNFEIYRWFLVLAAFVFFSFFGFADEARKHYRLVYTSVASRLGYSTASISSTGSSSGNYSFSKSRDDHLSGGKKSILPAFLKDSYPLPRSAQRKNDPLGETLDSSFDLGTGDLNIDTSGNSSNFGMAVTGRRGDVDPEKGDQKPWSPTDTTASSSMSHLEHLRDEYEKELPQRPQAAFDSFRLPTRSTRESRPLSTHTI